MFSIPLRQRPSRASTPLFMNPVKAGFPSPAADYAEEGLDFNALLVKRKAATYCLRVSGDSMIEAGILPEDIIVVDRSLPPAQGDIVVAALNGEFTVKRFFLRHRSVVLHPENSSYDDITVGPEEDFRVFGVVTAVVRRYRH